MGTRSGRIALVLGLLVPCVFACGREDAAKPQAATAGPPAFVADAACVECHDAEARAWRGSHHDRAMEISDPNAVLGDFSGAHPDFARVDGKYVVRADGPGGVRGEFA